MHARTRVASLSMLVAVQALSLAPSARAQDVAVTEDARTHFAAGVALLEDPKAPRYEEAYREFKAAYALSPSYKILGNLGLCAMKIERDGEAIQAYERYLKEAGFELTAEERQQIERDLLTLQAGHMAVTISTEPPGAAVVDVRIPVQGEEIHNSYGDLLTPLTLALRHGHHVMRARLAGYRDEEWEFESSGPSMAPHTFKMMKPALVVSAAPAAARPLPAIAYVTGALTLAAAAGGAVVGGLALKKHSDFDSLNDGSHVAGAESARSSGQTLNVVADSLFGAAILGAAATLYFVITRPAASEAPAPAALRPGTLLLGGLGGDRRSVTGTMVWVF